MSSTIEELEDQIKILEKKYEESKEVVDFMEMSKVFEDLVSKGLIKKRGNNLLSISEIGTLERIGFNTPTK